MCWSGPSRYWKARLEAKSNRSRHLASAKSGRRASPAGVPLEDIAIGRRPTPRSRCRQVTGKYVENLGPASTPATRHGARRHDPQPPASRRLPRAPYLSQKSNSNTNNLKNSVFSQKPTGVPVSTLRHQVGFATAVAHACLRHYSRPVELSRGFWPHRRGLQRYAPDCRGVCNASAGRQRLSSFISPTAFDQARGVLGGGGRSRGSGTRVRGRRSFLCKSV